MNEVYLYVHIVFLIRTTYHLFSETTGERDGEASVEPSRIETRSVQAGAHS